MKHTPAEIARDLSVSPRWIQKICRRIFGRRGRYRLTDDERAKVEAEQRKYALS